MTMYEEIAKEERARHCYLREDSQGELCGKEKEEEEEKVRKERAKRCCLLDESKEKLGDFSSIVRHKESVCESKEKQ